MSDDLFENAPAASGDYDSSSIEVLEGLEPDGGPSDGSILFAQGMLAYLTGDIDGADAAAEDAAEAMGITADRLKQLELVDGYTDWRPAPADHTICGWAAPHAMPPKKRQKTPVNNQE